MCWNISAVRAQGISHRQGGIPCQDFVFSQTTGDVYAAALSDGASTAAYADIGAETTVRTACAYLAENHARVFAEENAAVTAREILSAVRGALAEKADAYGAALSDFACTLLAVCVRGDQAVLAHIGDGVIACASACTGKTYVISAPDNGEYKNTTAFVTAPDAENRLRLYRCAAGNIGGFLLMSDGAAESLYQKSENCLCDAAPYLSLFGAVQTPAETTSFLESYLTAEILPHTSDDCSLLLLSRRMTAARCLRMVSPQRRVVFGTDDKRTERRLCTLLTLCTDTPRTVSALARRTHVRKSRVRARLRRLCACGVLVSENGRYLAVK